MIWDRLSSGGSKNRRAVLRTAAKRCGARPLQSSPGHLSHSRKEPPLKTRMLCFAIVAALIAALNPAMQAGDKKDKKDEGFDIARTGPEHKMLAKSEGTWDAHVKSWFDSDKPVESKGVMKRKMIMDGHYLREKFTGSFLGKDFEGLGIIGYDTDKKKFVMSWIDNFGNGITMNEGTYDTGKKTLTFV